MAIETQTISAENVIETETRVFAHPDDLTKLDLLNITAPTDIDYILNKVDSISNPIQDMGTFDPSYDGLFPIGAMSGWLFRISAEGTIGTMSMAIGDTIFAIADIVDRTDSSLWVKIDNTESNDIIRAGSVIEDDTLIDAAEGVIASSLAVRNYIDNAVTNLTDTLMIEIENAAGSSGNTIQITDWITIQADANGTDSVMTVLEPPKSIIRIYIEAWGDIIDGWEHVEGALSVIFPDDINHVGKRVKITYLV